MLISGMFENASGLYHFIILALVSFLSNIPLGYRRENSPKFSFQWFLWIHASIPLIVYLHIIFAAPKILIPIWIALAVCGQVVGSRWRRNTMTLEEKEALDQIPPIANAQTPKISDSQVAVVLLNMGGPKTNADVRDFQKKLFSDPMLIRLPLSWIFQKLFAVILSNARAKKTAARYQLIGGGSPIFHSTQKQVKALQDELTQRGRNFFVTFAFNYSDPFPGETIRQIKSNGKTHILPVSLYPHYSKATTGSSLHSLKMSAKKIYPEACFLDTPEYYLHDDYIRAFTERILQSLHEGESLDDFYLLFSAHGLPLYFLKEGDPYPFQIAQTVARVTGALRRHHRWNLSYQSSVGPLQWIKPSTEDMLVALARRNIKKVLIVPISFVSDHIETLWEINIQFRAMAEKLGISELRMSKALECHPGFISALADTIEKVCVCPMNN